MNETVIERIDVHARILWMPKLEPDVAIAWRALLERLLSETTGWDEAARASWAAGLSRLGPRDASTWHMG